MVAVRVSEQVVIRVAMPEARAGTVWSVRRIFGPVANEHIPLAAHRPHLARLLSGTATAYDMTFFAPDRHRTLDHPQG